MKGLALGIVAFLTMVVLGVANSDASSVLRRGAGCTGCHGVAAAAPSCHGKTVAVVPVQTVPVQVVKKSVVMVPTEVTTVETVAATQVAAACKAARVGILDRVAARRAEGKAKRAARRNVQVGTCAVAMAAVPVAETTCDVDDGAPEMGARALPPLPEVPPAPKPSSDL